MTESQVFYAVLSKIIEKFHSSFENRPKNLIHELTLSQYKKLAQYDVNQNLAICQEIENVIKEYKAYLKDAAELKKKKSALYHELTGLNNLIEKINTNSDDIETNENESQLKNDQSKGSAIKSGITSNIEKTAEKAVPVEPIYSTRPIRKPQENQEKSVNCETRGRYSNYTEEKSLDQSVLEGAFDITSLPENVSRKLQFDDVDDDDEEENKIFRQPKIEKKSESIPKITQSPRVFTPLSNLYEIPPPPVYSSSFGKQLNQS